MAKRLIKENSDQITRPAKRDVALNSSCYINNNGGSLYELDVPWLLNPVYANAKEVNFQRQECNTGYNSEGAKLQFSIYHAIHERAVSAANDAIFARPSSWSSSVNIVMPAGFSAGKIVTGNDGRQYVQMIDETGKVVSNLGEHSCNRVDSDVFNPLLAGPESLRTDIDHFNIKYNVKADGSVIPKTPAEAAIAAGLVDFENAYTKPSLNSLTIITNDVLITSSRFGSATKSGIETPVDPTLNFSSSASSQAPVQSVVLRQNAQVTPPWMTAKPDAEPALKL